MIIIVVNISHYHHIIIIDCHWLHVYKLFDYHLLHDVLFSLCLIRLSFGCLFIGFDCRLIAWLILQYLLIVIWIIFDCHLIVTAMKTRLWFLRIQNLVQLERDIYLKFYWIYIKFYSIFDSNFSSKSCPARKRHLFQNL